MATYKVIAPGFYNGLLYSPNGKRRVMVTEKPFAKNKKPSWVEPMKVSDNETVENTEADKSEGPLSAGEDNGVSFIADGDEQTPTVETL